VFDGATLEPFTGAIGSFLAYDTTFRGGVYVAVGDVNGDTRPDIITVPGRRIASHVRVFDALTSVELSSFLAYPNSFKGGTSVAAGDVNGDSRADVITAPGPHRALQIRSFDAISETEIDRFLAFEPSSRHGIWIAASRRR
jgi:hypothetical protein